jgi:hypothetical protein
MFPLVMLSDLFRPHIDLNRHLLKCSFLVVKTCWRGFCGLKIYFNVLIFYYIQLSMVLTWKIVIFHYIIATRILIHWSKVQACSRLSSLILRIYFLKCDTLLHIALFLSIWNAIYQAARATRFYSATIDHMKMVRLIALLSKRSQRSHSPARITIANLLALCITAYEP